ncbi:hypothetical protein ABMA27_004007 [Loxostege sticticalis]|uniref:Ig-like domain-containing protein n=1 Tax=Loxostege sticticalis TaxID=481309 RepID=A0ABR3HR55_LOXSC
MASEMKIPIVTILAFLLSLVKATQVEITQEWKPDFGWEVTCSWNLYMNDTLQSVNLSKNKQQFFIFRPETQYGNLRKTNTWDLVESVMKVDCLEAVDSGIKGKCVLSLEPQVPPRRDFTFGCEVSGERPYFRMGQREVTVEALVPPSKAVMNVMTPESGPASLNCSTSGLPAPNIIWTVDDQKVPPNFHGVPVWNATSKLWDVWSSFTPQPEALHRVQCTPEVKKGNQLVRGLASQYNDAYRIVLDGTMIIISALATLLL